MVMQLFCQILMVVQLIAALLRGLWIDLHGRRESEPEGFVGVVVSLVMIVLVTLVWWKAGALSLLIP
jgi:hypothetical protein